jgi:hypothetical protein
MTSRGHRDFISVCFTSVCVMFSVSVRCDLTSRVQVLFLLS